MMKTRKVIAEISGHELVEHYRQIVMEVPEDMTDREIECVNADRFNHVDEQTAWEMEESNGIVAVGYPELLDVAADDARPEVVVHRDDNGDYRVRPNVECAVSDATHGMTFDENDRTLLSKVEQHGWHLVGIGSSNEEPAYVFSVGLYHTFGHPEVCIFGLTDCETMAAILNAIGNEVKEGRRFEIGTRLSDILIQNDLVLQNVDDSLYFNYFGYARWFYRGNNFPLLQCVWPDRNNRFPWESAYDQSFLPIQPLLTEEPLTTTDAGTEQ